MFNQDWDGDPDEINRVGTTRVPTNGQLLIGEEGKRCYGHGSGSGPALNAHIAQYTTSATST